MLTLLAAACAVVIHLRWRKAYKALEARTARAEPGHSTTEKPSTTNPSPLERAKALFDAMSEGVVLLDASGRVQLVNRAALRMFRINRDVSGLGLLAAFQRHELPELIERSRDTRAEVELEFGLPGNDQRVLQFIASSLPADNGSAPGALLVIHDLSRLRQLENTRQEFVANVSHELRTPLSLIQGYVETLLSGAKDDPAVATKFLQTIARHSDRLTFLIEDLLTISSLESGRLVMNFQNIELREIGDRVNEDLKQRALEHGATVKNLIPAGWTAHVDGDRLQQVIFNLVENAINYGSNGGTVEMGAREVDSKLYEIWIKDDGPGIPESAQERVFERFFRVDRDRSRQTGGTGLGLSIVKHIVQAHGGEVRLESQPGSGTTFYFTVPRHEVVLAQST